jgi:hypothetical protein
MRRLFLTPWSRNDSYNSGTLINIFWEFKNENTVWTIIKSTNIKNAKLKTKVFAYYAFHIMILLILLSLLLFEIRGGGKLTKFDFKFFLYTVPLLIYISFVMWRIIHFHQKTTLKYLDLDWIFIFFYIVFRVLAFLTFNFSGGLSN